MTAESPPVYDPAAAGDVVAFQPNRAQRRAGNKRERRQYRIRFADDHELAGLEALMCSVPVGVFLDLAELAETVSDRDDQAKRTADQMAELRRMLQVVADALVEWNRIDEHDQPVPPTLDGLLGEEMPFISQLIKAWMDAVSGVSVPLEQRSTGGRPSEEASIPMETLSANPPN